MKKVILFLVGGVMMVSCGPTPEEVAAIKAIEVQVRSYERDLRMDSISINHWRGVLHDSTKLLDTRIYAGAKLTRLGTHKDELEANIAQLKIQLASLK